MTEGVAFEYEVTHFGRIAPVRHKSVGDLGALRVHPSAGVGGCRAETVARIV
jgi:hypothetical protein